MATAGEKTEKPTARRIEKARKDGRFANSKEFVSALQFLLFVAALGAAGDGTIGRARETGRMLIAAAFRPQLNRGDLVALYRQVLFPFLAPLLVTGLLLTFATMFIQLATTQFGLAPSKLAPDFSRLAPMARLKSLPSQNFSVFLQAVFLLPIFLGLAFVLVRENVDAFLSLPFLGLPAALERVGRIMLSLLWRAAWLFLIFGAIDLFRQRQRFQKELRMTKQEVREESKEAEGNPQMKMRVRRLQRELARRNMMKNVATATAVVVNPTHYAVAIRYDMESAAAPRVVAKGKNYLAQRIRECALESLVPIVENKPLAQALYQSVDVGQEIPVALYRAVAEILAYIYKLTHGTRFR